MNNSLSVYADGQAWLVIVATLSIAIGAVLISVKAFKRRERKRLSRRAPKQDKPERFCGDDCLLVKQYQENIAELNSEIEYWKQAYKGAEHRCSLMQDTISKLRRK